MAIGRSHVESRILLDKLLDCNLVALPATHYHCLRLAHILWLHIKVLIDGTYIYIYIKLLNGLSHAKCWSGAKLISVECLRLAFLYNMLRCFALVLGIFTLARAAYFVAKFDRLARYEYTHSVLICLWHDGHVLDDHSGR